MQPETKSVGLYSHIRNNNLTSAFLLFMFPFSVLLIIWSIGFGWEIYLRYLEGQGSHMPFAGHRPASAVGAGVIAVVDYGLFALLGCFAWVGVAAGFHEKFIDLATGSKTIERREYPELYNLLENLCISRGLKMPKLGIINSDAMNAFASGVSEKSYRVVVTKGLLETLDKNELEGVLAHELTHIMNKDVRMMIIATVFVGMISFISEMLWRSMRHIRIGSSRRSGKGDRSAGALVIIAAIALAIGYLFALLVRFSLSRTREYLADAGAVELTKSPGALASALRKISGHAKIENVPDEVMQMFIENPPAFTGLFSTHPPVEERIRILESMGGEYTSGASFVSGGASGRIEVAGLMEDSSLMPGVGMVSSEAAHSPWSGPVVAALNEAQVPVSTEADPKAFLDSVDTNNSEFAPQSSFFKTPWAFLALVLLLIGGGFLFCGFTSWHDESAYESYGRLTAGRVENLWTSHSNKSTNHNVKFSYKDENGISRVDSCSVKKSLWSTLTRGGAVEVQYLPGGAKSRVNGNGIGKLGSVLMGLVGLVILSMAVYLPHSFQRRLDTYKELKTSGAQTTGKITRVDSSAMTINKVPYTKIEYEFADMRGGKYTGKTRYLRLSLANDFKLGAKVRIFYDPQNPKKNISEIG